MTQKKPNGNRVAISHRISRELRKQFKIKCAEQDIDMNTAYEIMVKEFIAGRIKLPKK